ncbi:chromosome partitioning protein ParA [Vibrio sp. S4M6]|uniref:chromosome partitioning protein ParA n=1 Tax=Vibrio sinus TaxID=2946865 RepID=UPI00202A01BB|nr:chromosome partitioning protein ParA [Vibrio sinus]MCL9783069.1 chromosome partitioning protein ParA [Vibrio sinus]
MVSINGLPPSNVSSTRKTSKAAKKRAQDTRAPDSSSTVQPTKVANAISQSIRSVAQPDAQYSNLQYDFPPGENPKAMSHYLDVLNQSKREELARLIGVDIYI